MSTSLDSPVLELPVTRPVAPDPATEPRADRIVVKFGGELVFVRFSEIDWIEAQRDYVRFHAGPRTFLLRGTMNRLLERCAGTSLVRIHRSTIINTDRLQKLTPTQPGRYDAVLFDGTRLKVARTLYLPLLAR